MKRRIPELGRSAALAKRALSWTLLLAALAAPSRTMAQGENLYARALLKTAMEAYSILDLETAHTSLKKALAMAEALNKTDLAAIYIGFGVLWTGGYVDQVKGQRAFLIGLCLDSSATIDPMLFSPDIQALFDVAFKQVNPNTCKTALTGVALPASMRPKKKPPPPATPPAPKKIKVYEPIQQTMGQVIARRVVGEDPTYPKKARLKRVESVVEIKITISRDGGIKKYEFLKGDPLFQDAMADTIMEWRFKPHFVYDQPVETYCLLHYNFKLD